MAGGITCANRHELDRLTATTALTRLTMPLATRTTTHLA
jgi:hypothetical protein